MKHKLAESEEIRRLTIEYVERGGKIELLDYIKPDAFTIKQVGFMRKFERENE